MNLRLGLIKIPVHKVNLFNSSYSSVRMHRFSDCCKARVKNKKVCSNCGTDKPYELIREIESKVKGNDKVISLLKDLKGLNLASVLTNDKISKGKDKDTIFSDKHLDKLKELKENSTIEIIAIKDLKENTLKDYMPYFKKSQLILPSISKGFKKSDVKTFYGFKKALEEKNKYCIAKVVFRSKEHLVVLYSFKDDLIMSEIPFYSDYNQDEVNRLKTVIESEVGYKIDKDEYKEKAGEFIDQFDSDVQEKEIKEERKELIKEFIEKMRNGEEIEINKKEQEDKKEGNPFAVAMEK